MLFRRREPQVPLSAVTEILEKAIALARAGGQIAYDQTFSQGPAQVDDDDAPPALVEEDREFCNDGGTIPVFEELEEDEEDDEEDEE